MSKLVPRTRPKATIDDLLPYLTRHTIAVAIEKVVVVGIRGYYKQTMGKPFENDRNLYDDAMFIALRPLTATSIHRVLAKESRRLSRAFIRWSSGDIAASMRPCKSSVISMVCGRTRRLRYRWFTTTTVRLKFRTSWFRHNTPST
ncbi:MAG: hypothetical protein H0X08_06595 [Blastocatellia bacterium]|nr:hypothetical protein [Blastocatellia bacterium]